MNIYFRNSIFDDAIEDFANQEDCHAEIRGKVRKQVCFSVSSSGRAGFASASDWFFSCRKPNTFVFAGDQCSKSMHFIRL